jgi:hypothetical protein
MISLVGKQWVEVKTLAIGTIVPGTAGEARARELSYFSRRAEHRDFRRLALVETHRRGVGTAETVVAVMDGADWLQRFVDFHRRDAVRVLDFPHAVEYLTRASQEALGVAMAATADSKAWLARQAHALKHDGPTPVLAELRALPPGTHRDAALAYLEPRLPQLQYPTFRAAGYPIGSGIVESANKVVVEDRLKGSGMHWAPQHVDPMLALRTVVCADRWDAAWTQISARLLADDRARSHRHAAERRAARHAALQAGSQTPQRSRRPRHCRAPPPPPPQSPTDRPLRRRRRSSAVAPPRLTPGIGVSSLTSPLPPQKTEPHPW